MHTAVISVHCSSNERPEPCRYEGRGTSELNEPEPPGGFWAHVSETSLNRGANLTTLMKHLASSGLCPTFRTLKTVALGPVYYFYLHLTPEPLNQPEQH